MLTNELLDVKKFSKAAENELFEVPEKSGFLTVLSVKTVITVITVLTIIFVITYF